MTEIFQSHDFIPLLPSSSNILRKVLQESLNIGAPESKAFRVSHRWMPETIMSRRHTSSFFSLNVGLLLLS
jgi:hypothetical protein